MDGLWLGSSIQDPDNGLTLPELAGLSLGLYERHAGQARSVDHTTPGHQAKLSFFLYLLFSHPSLFLKAGGEPDSVEFSIVH